MHKNCKLTPVNRKELYSLWLKGEKVSQLSKLFRITRPVIYKVLSRARIRDFSIHKSINYRFRQLSYGLKKLNKIEKRISIKLAKRKNRYEKNYPGEMVHFDTKKLRRTRKCNRSWKSECLFIAIDDYSRYLVADILPTRDQECASIFLETTIYLSPYKIECAYSDNGTEFKGGKKHDFTIICEKNGIERRYTRPRRPKTNGKAERVIRTILEKCLRKYDFENREQRREILKKFVNYYNSYRSHFALKEGKTKISPCQMLENFLNQKVYTTLEKLT